MIALRSGPKASRLFQFIGRNLASKGTGANLLASLFVCGGNGFGVKTVTKGDAANIGLDQVTIIIH